MKHLIPPRFWQIVLVAGITLVVSNGCADIYNDLILDNKDHGIPCQELPTLDEVQQVIAENEDIVGRIMAVNPGFVFVDIDADTCPGHADIVISYDGHDDRVEIERLIDSEVFHGIPYRLRNR